MRQPNDFPIQPTIFTKTFGAYITAVKILSSKIT